MDYNKHTYLNNYINKFRTVLPFKELNIQTLHRIMAYLGVKPYRANIFNKSDIEYVLNSDVLLNKIRKLLGIYKEAKPEDFIRTPKLLKQPNYYSSDDMKQASDELLKNDEVSYTNECIKLTQTDIKKIVTEVIKKINNKLFI